MFDNATNNQSDPAAQTMPASDPLGTPAADSTTSMPALGSDPVANDPAIPAIPADNSMMPADNTVPVLPTDNMSVEPTSAPSIDSVSADASASSDSVPTIDSPASAEPTAEPAMIADAPAADTPVIADTGTPDNGSSTASEDTTGSPSNTTGADDLASMKQEALDQLKPLVEHLDLKPDEQFKTTMMMIQANDDQSLLPKAFEAAKQITDDKDRAQALLDIINEINYFTHTLKTEEQ